MIAARFIAGQTDAMVSLIFSEKILDLLARRKPANLRHRQPQILVGVYWDIVDADFVVKMRTSRASAEADVADGVATVDILSGGDGEAGKVAVAGRNAVP